MTALPALPVTSSHLVRDVETPLADALLRITATSVGSFHALPASGGRSLRGSALRDKYLKLFGSEYLASDVSWSSPVLDSFFRPRGCLARAQRLAADAFGADRTFFITTGTTTSNAIALAAMGVRGRRVLVDRACHQSVHFALDRAGADVTYSGGGYLDAAVGLGHSDIGDLVERFANAARTGAPFDAVVLSGSSYDGRLLKTPDVVEALFEFTGRLDILVDEAWSALNNFHPVLRENTALEAVRRFRNRSGKLLRMFVTHSAHKSMSALRQASYLHVVADESTHLRVDDSLYAIHTTSPSLPILASLDLARAQAGLEGAALLDGCVERAARLRTLVRDGSLPGLEAVGGETSSRWSVPDPTRVAIDFAGLGETGQVVRSRLFSEYGLYVARCSGTVLLFSFHAGVSPDIADRLEHALRDLCARVEPGRAGVDLTNAFVVAYPPGIPCAVPGEFSANHINEQLTRLDRAGVEVFSVAAQSSTN
jgi:arginine/lysine/ornithine decarboxylase